jgi:hypothetical protein
MKKIIFAIFIAAAFLISAKKEPARYATAEETGKAVLIALQNNDSTRFLQLYPTQLETNTAFVDPWKDSSMHAHQVQWVGKYYKNNNAMVYEMFRAARQKVIKEGIDWSSVKFISFETRQNPKSSTGIDYLYRGNMHCMSGDRPVDFKMTYMMQTKDGWNCGLGMDVRVGPTEQERIAQIQRMRADSARMADSIMVAEAYYHAKWISDSMRVMDSLKKAEMDYKKRPH